MCLGHKDVALTGELIKNISEHILGMIWNISFLEAGKPEGHLYS